MADTNIPMHCPKCGELAMKLSSESDRSKPFTCSKCGASGHVRELKTADGKTLLDIAVDELRNAITGIKGFKPTR